MIMIQHFMNKLWHVNMIQQSEQAMVSDSLILTSSKPGKEHCLGLPDWCACCNGDELCMAENNPNVAVLKNKERESKLLQLKGSRVATKTVLLEQKEVKNCNERFSFNDVTIEELDAFKEGDCPTNTAKNTEWVVRTFEVWRTARNKKHLLDLCPSELFSTKGHQEICDWLCKFVVETHKGDEMEYTPRSLCLLLSMLQRHARKARPLENINFIAPLRMFVIQVFA